MNNGIRDILDMAAAWIFNKATDLMAGIVNFIFAIVRPTLFILAFIACPFIIIEWPGPTIMDILSPSGFQRYDFSLGNIIAYSAFFWLAFLSMAILGIIYSELATTFFDKNSISSNSVIFGFGFGFIGMFFLPILVAQTFAFPVLITVSLLSGLVPTVLASLRLKNSSTLSITARIRLVVFCCILVCLPIVSAWVLSSTWILGLRALHGQGHMLALFLVDIPIRLLLETILVGAFVSSLVAWQLPVITGGRLLGVLSTALLLAAEEIDKLFDGLHSFLLDSTTSFFVYIPKALLRALIYILVFLVLKEVYKMTTDKLQKKSS